MSATTLSLETIGQIDDGAAETLIEQELQRAIADTDAFGADFKKRKVVIQVTFQVDKKSGMLKTSLQCQAKLPARETREVGSETKKERGVPKLLFEEFGESEAADAKDEHAA